MGALAVASGGVLLLLWDLRTYSNHVVLLVALAAILAATGPGDFAGTRAQPLPYATLLLTQVSTLYFFAGISKLNPDFLRGGLLLEQLHVGPIGSSAVGELIGPGAVASMAIATVFVELLLAVGLWLPGLRLRAALLGVTFHLATIVAMAPRSDLVVFSLLCVGTYPMFLSRQARNGLRSSQGEVEAQECVEKRCLCEEGRFSVHV
jgi:hypothetical protein